MASHVPPHTESINQTLAQRNNRRREIAVTVGTHGRAPFLRLLHGMRRLSLWIIGVDRGRTNGNSQHTATGNRVLRFGYTLQHQVTAKRWHTEPEHQISMEFSLNDYGYAFQLASA
jgi:hypothetical protein